MPPARLIQSRRTWGTDRGWSPGQRPHVDRQMPRTCRRAHGSSPASAPFWAPGALRRGVETGLMAMTDKIKVGSTPSSGRRSTLPGRSCYGLGATWWRRDSQVTTKACAGKSLGSAAVAAQHRFAFGHDRDQVTSCSLPSASASARASCRACEANPVPWSRCADASRHGWKQTMRPPHQQAKEGQAVVADLDETAPDICAKNTRTFRAPQALARACWLL